MSLEEFNKIIKNKLDIEMYNYQKHVSNEIIKNLDKSRFIVVSMPTGSGKTLIELYIAYHLLSSSNNIIVLEPTRLLCDQMYHRFWKKVFGDEVGVEYEGNCESFNQGKRIIVSTPFTTSKCLSNADVIIVDEVHHAFGNEVYQETLIGLEPKYVIGFTALLPSYKKYLIDSRLIESLGEPLYLTYDFKALSKIDPNFKLPKAIADVFDAEFGSVEDTVYDALFRGQIKGNKDTLKFLEVTLYTYGKEAFCESYRRLMSKVEENIYFDSLCNSKELSHKAKALIDVLKVYNGLKPVLIFTSRKSTAYEFERAISNLGKVKVLTGDSSRYERLKVVQMAKRGEIDIIISTLVGEEGIDIPEVRLLVMTDVPQSPLRFYQRLGRLIRGKEDNNSENNNLKYLVVTLTPKTAEYDNLDDALKNLYAEGVDVSYIIEKREDKGPVARIVDIINKQGGQALVGEIEGKKLSEIDVILGNISHTSQISQYVDRAIREGKALYYYDVDSMGNILNKILLGSYCNMAYGENYIRLCNNNEIKNIEKILIQKKGIIKIEKKGVLRPYMRIFLKNDLDKVINDLSKEKENLEKELKDKDYRIENMLSKVKNNIYSQLLITATVDRITISPKVQINYYDMTNDKLVKLNSILIAYNALSKFYKLFQ